MPPTACPAMRPSHDLIYRPPLIAPYDAPHPPMPAPMPADARSCYCWCLLICADAWSPIDIYLLIYPWYISHDNDPISFRIMPWYAYDNDSWSYHDRTLSSFFLISILISFLIDPLLFLLIILLKQFRSFFAKSLTNEIYSAMHMNPPLSKTRMPLPAYIRTIPRADWELFPKKHYPVTKSLSRLTSPAHLQ